MDKQRYTEVLEQLDMLAKEYGFPMFGAADFYIDSRMSVFADQKHWGILMEVIEVSTGNIDLYANENYVFRFGNCLSRPLGLKENRVFYIASDGDDEPLLDSNYHINANAKTMRLGPTDFDSLTGSNLNTNANTMRLRGHLVSIPRDLRIYESKGIHLIDKNEYDPKVSFHALENGKMIAIKDEIWPTALLRVMTPEYRDYFFLSEKEKQIEFLCPIPQILQLEEWRHPLYDESNIVEPPSKCETFQLIARVIETCDPSFYKPTEKPNTHWSNWLTADKYL